MPSDESKYCLAIVWPYTEHNICVLDKGHDGNHQDDKGRKFGVTKYLPGELNDKDRA